eukprot:1390697-Rhodomonas_salina.4
MMVMGQGGLCKKGWWTRTESGCKRATTSGSRPSTGPSPLCRRSATATSQPPPPQSEPSRRSSWSWAVASSRGPPAV